MPLPTLFLGHLCAEDPVVISVGADVIARDMHLNTGALSTKHLTAHTYYTDLLHSEDHVLKLGILDRTGPRPWWKNCVLDACSHDQSHFDDGDLKSMLMQRNRVPTTRPAASLIAPGSVQGAAHTTLPSSVVFCCCLPHRQRAAARSSMVWSARTSCVRVLDYAAIDAETCDEGVDVEHVARDMYVSQLACKKIIGGRDKFDVQGRPSEGVPTFSLPLSLPHTDTSPDLFASINGELGILDFIAVNHYRPFPGPPLSFPLPFATLRVALWPHPDARQPRLHRRESLPSLPWSPIIFSPPLCDSVTRPLAAPWRPCLTTKPSKTTNSTLSIADLAVFTPLRFATA
ncbi:hypothetical protein DFH09DRAFT_1301279 [Mycena vulgaris]|nr:hypothetical protein DFH09DRAFT_1301279 [Mycena vulgaris]